METDEETDTGRSFCFIFMHVSMSWVPFKIAGACVHKYNGVDCL